MPYQCVIKIDPGSMTGVDRWSGVEGQVLDVNGSVLGLFAGLDTPHIVNIDVNTMTEVNRWTGSVGEIPQKLALRIVGG